MPLGKMRMEKLVLIVYLLKKLNMENYSRVKNPVLTYKRQKKKNLYSIQYYKFIIKIVLTKLNYKSRFWAS